METTTSGAFSYPGNTISLLIPTFHHEREREREKLCDKGGTMHILSFRQQTPICIFLLKEDAYALSLIRVYETKRKKESKKDEFCGDVLL